MKIIITGSTGMVGKGVLLECLEHPQVESILVVNRKPLELKHPKLNEVILKDFTQFESIQNILTDFDACFHCMGVSSAGKSEKDFYYYTYTMTESLINTLAEVNKEMVITYVSGMGTDSSEKGRIMWARVKGKTENMILNKGFKDAYAFRPGVIIPEKGVKSKTRLYQIIYDISRPLFPLLRKMNGVTTSSVLGQAMIKVVQESSENKFLENKDINKIGRR